ncbi:MAG: CRISPR-associated endonuclease Cas2 [Rhodovibrionaceae bacterium]
MYLFVFFDLPVKTKKERRDATRFRKFLVNDGYDMMQLSVYTRVCRGQDAADKHLGRAEKNLPPQGSVRALQVTERQFGRMKLLVGKRTRQEKTGIDQLVLL